MEYQRPIDQLKGALKSKSILLFILLQFAMGAAQPYLASTGIDPMLANMAIDIAAVIALRFVTKSSLAEKGSGLEKVKDFVGSVDKFINNPFYKPMLVSLMKEKGIDTEFFNEIEPEPEPLKKVKINGRMYYAMDDGSYKPV